MLTFHDMRGLGVMTGYWDGFVFSDEYLLYGCGFVLWRWCGMYGAVF